MARNTFTYKRKVINEAGMVVLMPKGSAHSEIRSNPTIDPYAQSSEQEFPLGSKLVGGDRVWRYVKAGGGELAIAVPTQGAVVQHTDAEDDIVVGASAAVGDTEVVLTSATNIVVAIDYYKEGYLIVNDEAGEGQMYKIKTSPALVSTNDSTFTLYDPLTIALTTASQVGLRKSPFDAVIATAAPLTNIFTGIPMRVITTLYYGWLQTGGLAAVETNAAITVGQVVYVGTTAAQVDPGITDVKAIIPIGVSVTPGIADTEKCMVWLNTD